MPTRDLYHVPAHTRERFDDIIARMDAVADAHLDAEYAELCRRMAAVLARKRPSPLAQGEARTWAAGILHAVGWVNFLSDPSQQPHMTAAELAAVAGVGQSTNAATFRKIRETLDLVRMDPEWTRPGKLIDNPLAWMVSVNGMPTDVRRAPQEVQEEAFRCGLIPFVPETHALEAEIGPPAWSFFREPLSPGTAEAIRDTIAEAKDLAEQMVDSDPDVTEDELTAAARAPIEHYNRRAQAELGGLSPTAVHQLLRADWESAESAIRLNEFVMLGELESSRMLHSARLVLVMLAERGSVKATPKGNLPRTFVNEFRERMHAPDAVQEWGLPAPQVANEEDLSALRLPRILLELAGLIKRRNGRFSRTRRGDQLASEDRAGALFVALVRTHFRRLDLEYLDGIGPAPAFQHGIGYTVYQFGRVAAEWRSASELRDALVLPGIRDELPIDPYFDVTALMLETRFLRPLEAFGLAEARVSPRRAGALRTATYRKAPLFNRVLSFRVTSE